MMVKQKQSQGDYVWYTMSDESVWYRGRFPEDAWDLRNIQDGRTLRKWADEWAANNNSFLKMLTHNPYIDIYNAIEAYEQHIRSLLSEDSRLRELEKARAVIAEQK